MSLRNRISSGMTTHEDVGLFGRIIVAAFFLGNAIGLIIAIIARIWKI